MGMAHGRLASLLGLAAAALAMGLGGSTPAQVNPFGKRGPSLPDGAVKGVIHTSDGKSCSGALYMVEGRRLRVFDPKEQQYLDYSLSQVKEIVVNVVNERVEDEWRFKEGGSDEKVFTGKKYCRKDFEVVLVLPDGQKRKLNVARGMPIYCLTDAGETRRLLLQPFLRGEVGGPAADLVHPTRIVVEGVPAKDPAPQLRPQTDAQDAGEKDRPQKDGAATPARSGADDMAGRDARADKAKPAKPAKDDKE
jgi:hypothetical protein